MPNTAVRVGEGAAVFCLGQVTFNSHPYMSVFASKITIFTVDLISVFATTLQCRVQVRMKEPK